MADTLARRLTLEEVLAWEERQENHNEFVNGRNQAMVGGARARNKIAINVAAHLTGRLKGGKCQAYGSDMKIVTPVGNGDVTVDCGPMKSGDIAATEPTMVVEALSKSTAWADQTQRLDDYQSISAIGVSLSLETAYEGVEFDAETAPHSDNGEAQT